LASAQHRRHDVQCEWYADKDNTWEPIEHLAGCEDMVAEFKERQRTSIAQHEAAAQAKHAEKAAAAAQTVSEAAATSAAAARVEAPADEDQRRSPRKEAERLAAVVAGSPAAAGQHDLGTRRSAQVWAAFDTTTGAPCVARRAASYRSSEPCREWRVRGVHLDWGGI
jgi:hypothetical protein